MILLKKDYLEGIYLAKSLAYFMNILHNKDINRILFMQSWNKEKKMVFKKFFAKNILMLMIFNLNA